MSTIGSNNNLSRVARQIGFDNGYIILNPGHRGPATASILATAIEAVLGAIYWDSKNEQAVRVAMVRMGLATETPTSE